MDGKGGGNAAAAAQFCLIWKGGEVGEEEDSHVKLSGGKKGWREAERISISGSSS